MNYQEILTKLANVQQKIPHIKEVFRTNTLHNFPNYYYLYTDVITQNSDLYKSKYKGSASSLSKNREEAILKVYGEALERFSSSMYNIRDLPCKTQQELEEEQIPHLKLKDFINNSKLDTSKVLNAKYYWTTCQDENNNVYYLPAQMVFVPFSYDDSYIRLSITTGTALRASIKSTKYHAIMEVLERHDFMCSFLNQEPYQVIPLEIIKEHSQINELIKDIEEDKTTKLHIYKINTQEEYHSILTILESTDTKSNHKPALCIGTSTDTNFAEAIQGSLLEAIKGRIWIEQLLLENPNYETKITKKEEVKNVLDRIFYYAQHKHKQSLKFILNQKNIYGNTKSQLKKKNTLQDEEKFDVITSYLKLQKIKFYFANLTPKEAQEEEIYIYKCIIPKMQPVYLFEHFKYDIGEYITKNNKIIPPLPFL